MYPFRTDPDTIDRVVCGRCGHPVWDHCNDSHACDSHDVGSACWFFGLTGFTAASQTDDQTSPQQRPN